MSLTINELLSLIGAVAPALAVYVGIRADMAEIKAKLQRAEQDIQALFTIKAK